MSLKQYGIIDKILPALEDGKSGKRREGALLSIERLCLGMGRLFEPYVIRLISGLLNAFGDANPSVREAAWNAARAIMSKLSAHGVRLVLPALLRAIDSEQSWRTKAQSVELLATMTHCAPKQLSACLPQIVPRLLEVLVTSQEQLKEAGTRALQHIGNVIRNPEVQALVPLLTNCLQDPLADRMPCLLALRDTCFVHVLDAPSLALILPVIQRAFTDRNTEARKTAAQIFGNLHSLARKEELQPYVANILPPLKSCLLDAVPEVRSVAAAALGSLVRGMGEPCFKEVLPWLLDTLTCESSSVDRSGAAQGLAEVLGAMGIDRLRSILPDLIRTASSDMKVQPHVRDGYLMLFIYLPAVFKDAFSEFIGPVVPTILKSLSDETEFLRETALKAAQRIVRMFADSSVELLLPEFERGMGDSNWRIRHASVQLVGDLLYQLSGYSGKGTTKTHDEDDTFGTNEAHEHLKQMMGLERHDRVLARLHIARSDPTSVVRQSAVHVWKVIVPNTSRTLREIMPTLVRLILSILGAPNREQQQLAARSLGDVVRKLGERILPEIIPLLLQILDSPDPDGRRGVCNGLMEIIRNCPREQLTNYTDVLLVPVRRALCDELPEVRRSGARAFELLHNILGLRSLEGILPDLMSLLDDSESNPYALDGLRQLLVVKGKAVMPYLIPKLIYPTVNVKAFAYLASVAGESLSRQLGRILPALLTLVSQSNEQRTDEDVGHCAEVLICVYDLTGVRYILNALLTGIGPASTQSAPTTFGQVVPGTVAYRLACLRLLSAYLEISFDACDMSIGHDAVIAASGKDRDITKSDDGEEESDDYRSEDYSDEDEDDSEETDSDDNDMLDNENDEPPDAKESVSKVLREFYPLALRNLCRLLAFRDEAVLVYCWKCLESLVKRWSPETLSTQINDLRQGIRGAASESHKSTPSKNSKDFLPGLSDPKLPVTVLVKLFADCILRGHPDIKEPASQALLECITHASGPALQSSVIKVLGPLIRLLGERQTNVVRASVVESLTALVTKCPHSARPFVTQLQTTFLKCLGDTHRPIRLLGGRGLASLVELTPRLDLLLSDLSRFSTNAVLSSLPSGHLPAGLNLQEFAPTLGTAATALTQTGIAKYPETSLQALRLCLLGSSGKASMSTLDSILSMLSPLMFIQDSGSNKPGLIDDSEPCDEDSDVENSSYETDDSARGKVAAVNFEAIRVVSSVCMGCAVAAANSTLRRQSGDAPVSAESMGCLVDMLQRTVFVHSVKPERWTHLHSKAIFLLVVLNHAPMAVINEHSIHSGFLKNMEDFLAKLCLNDQSEVWQLGYRCIGSYLGHTVETPEAHHDCRQPMSLLTSGIKHSAIETRLLVTTVATHVSWRWKLADPACSEHSSELSLPMFLSLLLVGSRDKVSGVRQSAEAAVAVLTRLGGHANKESNAAIKVCLDALDAGNRSQLDSLLQRLRKQSWAEVYSRGCPNMDSISTSLCS
ncbi:unnamed protein product [Dicrocoelium dendriticum]|nr:unnamed protein product [Dicrocoelium dendriticum]